MLIKLARPIVDLLFPIYCVGCGRDGGIICGQCAGDLVPLSPPWCRICAAPGVQDICRWCLERPRGFESLRSPYRFEGHVRDAIHALKYRGIRAASETLGELMARHLVRNSVRADSLVPVPLHHSRLRSRGYNQSALLAKELARHTGLPVREDLLSRVGNARPQVETSTQEERRSNVAGNFACEADASGLDLLLIDDVATTASTLSECAAVLRNAGASHVSALTFARDA